MSRIITSGAEWGVTVADVSNAPDGKLVQGATPQFTASATAAYVRSGAFGWRMTPSAAAGNFGYAEFTPTALNFFATTYWFRIYFKRISGTPITAPGDPFFHVYDSTGPFLQLMMDTSGRLVVRNVVAAANALVGGQIDDGQWHRVEVSYNMPSTSGNTTVDCYLDGTRVGTGYSGNMRNLSANGCRLGATAVSSTVLDWALDDFALNDDGGGATQQNSRPGDGKIVLLRPISDSAIGTGWAAGGGGTTNLFTAVDNTPPVGVADTGTNTSQIRQPTSNATANYDATLTSYTTAGVGASDTIQLCQWCINHGTASATSPPTRAGQLVSNPAEAGEVTLTTPTAAAGTFPTNWLWHLGPLNYMPTVTKGTSPVMRIGKRTASTRVVDVDAMGLYVEYLPVGGVLNKLTISSPLTVSSSVQKKVRKPVTRSVVASPTTVRKAKKPINRSVAISPTIVRKARKPISRSMAISPAVIVGKKYSKQISAPLSFGGGAAPYQAAVLADSPSGYWRLNETSGTAAADLGSGSHAGTYGADVVKGVSPLVADGKAASFPGGAVDGSFVHIADPVLPGVDNNFTIEAWLKLSAGVTTSGYIVSLGDWNANGVSFFLGANGGGAGRDLVVLVNAVAWAGAAYHIPDVDTTVHVALVVTTADWEGASAETQRWYTVFVNGVQVAQLPSSKPNSITNFIDIGGEYLPFYRRNINAVLDEVAVYGTALSASQLLAHYNAGIASGTGGITLSLKFLRGRAITAGLTIQPMLVRKTSRKFSRPLTLSGTIVKKARISRPRALTITSALVRKPRKSVGAPLSLSVSVGRAKTSRRAISASSALSVALARRVRLTRSRPLTLTASNARKLRLSRSRTLSLTASIGRKERMSISRPLVFSLNLAKKRRTVLVRTLNFTLPDTMKVKKAFSTATTMVSTVTPRKIAGAPGVRLIQVSLITAPTIKRKAQLKRSLSLGTTPTVNRRTKFKLTRSLSFSFVLQKRRFRAFTRTLTMTNTISRKPGKKVQRSLTISPNLKRRASLTTRATLQHSLALKRKVRMTQTLVLSLPASEKLKTVKRLTRLLTLTATETHARIGRRFTLAVQLKLNPAVTPSKKQSRLMQVALRLTSKVSARKRREKGQLTTRIHRPTILRTTKKPEILSADGSKATDIERVK